MPASLPASAFQVLGDFTLVRALELFLPTCLLMLGNQAMYQKFFSAKSEKAASHAVVWWIVGTVILETVIVAMAVVGSVLFPTGEVHEHPREILAWTASHGLSGSPMLSLLGAVLMGAIFAKILSTANNFLFPGDEFGERYLPSLSGAECFEQADAALFRAYGGAAGLLGALSVAQY